MSRDIKWQPNVCSCIIMQCRKNPDLSYEFTFKCNLHELMSDSEARENIINLCIEKSKLQEENGN